MLEKLTLTHFRSHQKSVFSFEPGSNLIIGNNGIGKTNIVEAIYILSQGKSFLATRLQDAINWENADFALIKANTDEHELEYILDNRAGFKRIAKIDGGKIALKYFVGRLPVVLFEPMDLNLVTGSPSLRRNFIDRVLSQISLEYRNDLKQFQRLLVQRNALLKKIRAGESRSEDLTQWDSLMAPVARNVISLRKKMFDFFGKHIQETMVDLSEQEHTAEYHYLPSVRHEEHYFEVLRDSHALDIAAGMTLNGPQRDDFSIAFDAREAATFASRGEQRLTIISLFLLERLLIKEYLGEEPIFLCDDVLSELDEKRQSLFLKAINNCQVIITSAHDLRIDGNVNRITISKS